MAFGVFQDYTTYSSLLISTKASGLITITVALLLYTIGRKEFLNDVKDSKIASILITIVGFALIGGSTWFLVFCASFSTDYYGRSLLRTTSDWMTYLISLGWGGFGFISGLLWLVDGGKIGESEALPLKKEIDFEEAWKKYPKDLFAEYVERYPHNPEGVLEWHINKKMKEDKTREQAIEELIKESK